MKNFLIYIFVLLPLIGCSQKGKVVVIDNIATFEKEIKQENVQLVDVRRTAEYEKGFIRNALHIDVLQEDTFKEKVGKLDPQKPIYVYCHAGGRSKKASTILLELGFKEIYDFSPGYKGWTKKSTN